MKRYKKILLILLLVLVVIQFFRPGKNQSTIITANNIHSLYPSSVEITTILSKACNDCHSNNTIYPWYSNVQPVAWWLNSHIKDGKRHLNFSEFGTYSIAKQYHKTEEAEEAVTEGWMPLGSYTSIHKDAKLTAMEKQQLTTWFKSIRDSLQTRYPADSLVMPRRN